MLKPTTTGPSPTFNWGDYYQATLDINQALHHQPDYAEAYVNRRHAATHGRLNLLAPSRPVLRCMS
jgi:Tfp pilus assembly protein PilF